LIKKYPSSSAASMGKERLSELKWNNLCWN
jgi:hypothetical protein